MKIAHIGVVCGEKNAKVPSNTGENQSLSLQIAEQRVESAGKKSGMLWFQYKVIIFFRSQ